MKFSYRAKQSGGDDEYGVVEASSQEEAVAQLKEQGLFVVTVTLESTLGVDAATSVASAVTAADLRQRSLWHKLRYGSTVPAKVQMVFFKQLAIMLRAGIPLSTAITAVGTHIDHPVLISAVAQLRSYIDRGLHFSDALRSMDTVFDVRTVALAEAGEESGRLDRSLDDISALLEKGARVRGRIKSAMFYPVFVILFAIGTMAAFVTLILPRFQVVFKSMKLELPPMTQFVFDLGNWLRASGPFLGLLLAALASLLFWASRTPETRAALDRIYLKIPLIRTFILRAALAQSTQTLASLVNSNVDILRSLDLAGQSVRNSRVRESYDNIREYTKAGRRLGEAALADGLFPPLICQMISIGEETGRLDEMLHHVSVWYEEELDQMVSRVTALLEPLMILFIGLIVMMIATAVFGPITSAMRSMSRLR